MHDLTVDRTTNGKGYVKDLTYEYIRNLDAGAWFSPSFAGEKVPTLSEVLEKFYGKVLLIIELKGVDRLLPRKVINILKKYNALEKVVLISFNKFHLDSIKNIEPTIKRGINIETLINNPQYLEYEFINFDGNIPFDTSLILFYKNKGINVVPYTINNLNKIFDFAKKGINIFITDYPQFKKELYLYELWRRDEKIKATVKKGLVIVYNPYNSFIRSEIYDIMGRKVSVHYLNPGLNSFKINISQGVYFIKIKDEIIKFLYIN
jgi:glycerophosphoryl diester phosphodiesterase